MPPGKAKHRSGPGVAYSNPLAAANRPQQQYYNDEDDEGGADGDGYSEDEDRPRRRMPSPSPPLNRAKAAPPAAQQPTKKQLPPRVPSYEDDDELEEHSDGYRSDSPRRTPLDKYSKPPPPPAPYQAPKWWVQKHVVVGHFRSRVP
jgi:hypothetical protein